MLELLVSRNSFYGITFHVALDKNVVELQRGELEEIEPELANESSYCQLISLVLYYKYRSIYSIWLRAVYLYHGRIVVCV